MRIFNQVPDEDKERHRYHYAALYPLLATAESSNIEGYARLWVRSRWNPRKAVSIGKYQSVTLEVQADHSTYKLEAWVHEHHLIIQITDNNRDGGAGLHPSANHRFDLNNPRSISEASIIVQAYLKKGKPVVRGELFRIPAVLYLWIAIAMAVITFTALWKVFS